MAFFTFCCHFWLIAASRLKIIESWFVVTYFLYVRMLVILPLNKFGNYLTPLVLSLCCFLFTVPMTTLCCIIEFLMPFDDSVETLRIFVSTALEGIY